MKMELEWQLMRLFVGEPVWTAYNRPQENHPAREEYVKKTMMTHKHDGIPSIRVM